MSVLDMAYVQHERKCDLWRGLPLSEFVADGDGRIAQPFGRPVAMPDHHWRVSPDVEQELYNASPRVPWFANPKSSHGLTRLLFGWPIEVDRSAPVGTLLLLISEPAALSTAVHSGGARTKRG